MDLGDKPSYKGVLIENQYFLDVLVDIDGCTCLCCNGCCGKYPGFHTLFN